VDLSLGHVREEGLGDLIRAQLPGEVSSCAELLAGVFQVEEVADGIKVRAAWFARGGSDVGGVGARRKHGHKVVIGLLAEVGCLHELLCFDQAGADLELLLDLRVLLNADQSVGQREVRVGRVLHLRVNPPVSHRHSLKLRPLLALKLRPLQAIEVVNCNLRNVLASVASTRNIKLSINILFAVLARKELLQEDVEVLRQLLDSGD